MAAIGQVNRIDSETISRISAMAMDVLVVAAIASLNLKAVVAMLVPFSILFIAGGIWTAICLLLISRWLLPKEYWFELGLINYGMSTGTTANRICAAANGRSWFEVKGSGRLRTGRAAVCSFYRRRYDHDRSALVVARTSLHCNFGACHHWSCHRFGRRPADGFSVSGSGRGHECNESEYLPIQKDS